MPATTARAALRYALLTDAADEQVESSDLAQDVDAVMLIFLPPGTFAARPAPGTAGRIYQTTDTDAFYFDQGTTWRQMDIQQAGGGYPLSMSQIAQAILLSGTLGSRPSAAAGNHGFYYFATDTSVIYQSDGSAWSVVAAPGATQGILASRPAAAAANRGQQYFATDQHATYLSDGSAWTRISADAGKVAINLTATVTPGSIFLQGQAWPSTTGIYADLFALYGGANLPDMQTFVPVGRKAGDASFGTLLGTLGEKTHVLTLAESAAHVHHTSADTGGQSADHTHGPGGYSVNAADNQGGGAGQASTTDNSGASVPVQGNSGGTSVDHTHHLSADTDSKGGGGAHNNIQPSIVVNFEAKL